MLSAELILNIIALIAIVGIGLHFAFSDPILDGYFICDYCNEHNSGPSTYKQNVTSTVCSRCGNEMRHEISMPD